MLSFTGVTTLSIAYFCYYGWKATAWNLQTTARKPFMYMHPCVTPHLCSNVASQKDQKVTQTDLICKHNANTDAFMESVALYFYYSDFAHYH